MKTDTTNDPILDALGSDFYLCWVKPSMKCFRPVGYRAEIIHRVSQVYAHGKGNTPLEAIKAARDGYRQ